MSSLQSQLATTCEIIFSAVCLWSDSFHRTKKKKNLVSVVTRHLDRESMMAELSPRTDTSTDGDTDEKNMRVISLTLQNFGIIVVFFLFLISIHSDS